MPVKPNTTKSKKKIRQQRPKWFEVRSSRIQGSGAFALGPIPNRTRIIEYTGERITHEEADARYDDAAMERHHTFLFTVDEQTVIDGMREGNDSRYINHSCEPNCETVVEQGRIFVDAIRDIAPGEELFFDYAYERDEEEDPEAEKRYACRCGAKTCRKTILAPRVEKPEADGE
jgi:SET domain-containing protein